MAETAATRSSAKVPMNYHRHINNNNEEQHHDPV